MPARLAISVSVTANNVSATGNMMRNRFRHTATLLPNGEALLIGGQGGGPALTTAELFHPSSGTFTSAAGSLAQAEYHAATLLGSGKVLVTGGKLDPFTPSNNLKSAELFDPATGTFSSTGDMTVERSAHPATLLANGKVLVTGGDWNSLPLASAELYDPATGVFALTASNMNGPRRFHTATLLSDGKVLLTGGDPGSGTALPRRTYDPITDVQPEHRQFERGAHVAHGNPVGKWQSAGGRRHPEYFWERAVECRTV